MNIRGRLISYLMISIVFPIVIYLASVYGNDMLKEFASISFIFIAIIIFFYSFKLVNYVFKDRGHEIVDKDFVIRVNLAIILMFLVRYVAISLFKVTEIPSFLIKFSLLPFIILLIIPFMRNYCLNKKTVKVTLLVSFILVYIIMPVVMGILENIFGNNLLVLTSVYEKYFIYNSASNQWLMYIMELIKVEIPDIIVLLMLNFMKFIMWCIVFLPYFVINFVLIDELSYMELCIELPKRKIALVFVVMIACVVLCVRMTNKGAIELLYSLKHY